MKNYLHILSILFVWSALLFSSCSDDENVLENPPVEDSITEGSDIATLIQRAAIEDRSFDDFIDLADCLSINLPLTITINDISITINDENDYDDVIALITKLNNKFDLEIVYPIVITLSDYTQIVINSEDELIPYVEACQEMDNDIPCIEFVFPLSFSIYNIEFELIDTIEINSNEELYFFIGNIEAGTLVSLNFPVMMQLQNGDNVEVNNNTELQDAIQNAELECNMMNQTEFGCHDFFIVEQECDDDNDGIATVVIATSFNWDSQDCVALLPFSTTLHFTLEDAINNVPAEGIIPNEPLELTSQTLYRRTERISTGEFEIQPLEIVVEACDGVTDFSCFDEQEYVLTSCVNSSLDLAYFNLNFANNNCENEVGFTITYHFTEDAAITNQSPIAEVNNYAVESPYTENTIYIRVSPTDNPEEFNVYELTLIVENCNDQICDESTLNAFLNDCIWVTDGTNSFTLNFNNGEVTATLVDDTQTGQYTTSTFNIESSGQFFTQFTLSGFTGNFEILNNVYETGFCLGEVINLHSLDPANNPIPFNIIERDCSLLCDNPGVLIDDLVIYMPFGDFQTKELISGMIINDNNDYDTDRDGNEGCASLYNGEVSILIPVTNENSLTTNDNITVSLWFKMNNTQAGDLETLFSKGSTPNESFTIAVYDLNTPLVFSENPPFNLWDDDWNQEVDVDWENTDWHHLVVTRDANNFAQLWRDGVLRNEGLGMDIGLDALINYELGNNFTGSLDDLRVYRRVLNPNEITTLYQLPADCYDCVEY